MKNIIASLAFVLFTANSFVYAFQPIWIGDWVGRAKTATEHTRVKLHIFESNGKLGASLSLLDVGVAGWPVSSIKSSAERLHIELPSDSGVQKMELALDLDKDTLKGKWVEPGRDEEAILHLKKTNLGKRNIEKRVIIDGPAGKIGASIFLPNQKDVFRAIVFLHGSGPQPRDASRFAAQRFAELGIASIIYDKRGVGESAGTFAGATFEDLAADAIAVANYMLAQPNVSTVGFSGHSQGGWVSTLAGSLWVKTAFVITSAGPAVPPSREAHWTVVRAMRKNGDSREAVREARKVIEDWHSGIRTGDWTKFDRSFAKAKKKAWFKGSTLIDFAEKPSKEFSSNYKAYMDYDPIRAMKALNVPYLAILSPDDESIDAIETMEILKTLKKPNISLRRYEGYDHSMRKIGKNGGRLRWPAHPDRYFFDQYKFISSSVR